MKRNLSFAIYGFSKSACMMMCMCCGSLFAEGEEMELV